MDVFHITFIVLFLAMAAIRSYYRWQGRAGNTSERTAEPVATAIKIFVGAPLMLGILGYLIRPQILNWSSFPLPAAWRWAGAAIVAGSLAGLMWVHAALAKNFSSSLRIRSDQTLVTSGPYRYVRHPMYSAFLLMFIGMGLLAANWFIGAGGVLLVVLFMVFRTPQEEAMMVNAFGDQYRRYAETTGRFFPRLRTHPTAIV